LLEIPWFFRKYCVDQLGVVLHLSKSTVKVILQFTGMSLLPAKQLVDNAPSTIRTDLEEKKANIFKEALEKAGATAKVEPTKD